MQEGIKFDHLLDPDERKRIELGETKQIELEQLNKRILSEEQAKRWAEEIRKKTGYGEKVIVFAASQAHALMLTTELNSAFNSRDGVSPRYAEPVIAENDELNYTIKEWFERPYQNPRIVVSVDIMTTGVDVPCIRYINCSVSTTSLPVRSGISSSTSSIFVKYRQPLNVSKWVSRHTLPYTTSLPSKPKSCVRRKVWENKEYEPSEEDLAFIKRWANQPDVYLNEAQG